MRLHEFININSIKPTLTESSQLLYQLKMSDSNEEIQQLLTELDAEPKKLPNGAVIYIVGNSVIEWDKKFEDVDVEDFNRWIYDVDIESIFPQYEEQFNAEFWKRPQPLYHATIESNVQSILEHGLGPRNQTRGMSNRGVGDAVFTTNNYEDTAEGSYGDFVFEIDTQKMKAVGNMPLVSQEPDIQENDMRQRLAWMLGFENWQGESEAGMYDSTIIVHGAIPPDCLKLMEN